jgi:DNA-binding response OmpR family regulator
MQVAIADDDVEVRRFIADTLTVGGYVCTEFSNGRDVIKEVARTTFDLVFLDWNMPLLSGIEVTAWLRANVKPVPAIIVLTSRNDKDDIVRALEAGADDFISKPEAANVILARAAAALRRARPSRPDGRYVQRGLYTFDKLAMAVTVGEQDVALTAKEFALADLLFENLQRPLSRQYILQRIWNNAADLSTRTLDMHISRLRGKLDLRPGNGYVIVSVFGYGYRLDSFDAIAP